MTTTLAAATGRELPTMAAALAAVRSGQRVDAGMHRSVHRTPGSYWVYKAGSCEVNKAEIEAMTRVRMELAASSSFDWVRVPEAVLMQDHHYIAVEYIQADYKEMPSWCEEYYPEYCGDYCKRHRIEREFNLEDMHAKNIIKKDGRIYLIDLGGAWGPEDCCDEEEGDVVFKWEDPWGEK